MPGFEFVPSFSPEPAHAWPETFGGGVTVTVAELGVEPPAFVQVIVKTVVTVSAPVDWLPFKAFAPVQAPFAGFAEALHESAPDDAHVNVDAAPDTIEVGFAARGVVNVGADGASVDPLGTFEIKEGLGTSSEVFITK